MLLVCVLEAAARGVSGRDCIVSLFSSTCPLRVESGGNLRASRHIPPNLQGFKHPPPRYSTSLHGTSPQPSLKSSEACTKRGLEQEGETKIRRRFPTDRKFPNALHDLRGSRPLGRGASARLKKPCGVTDPRRVLASSKGSPTPIARTAQASMEHRRNSFSNRVRPL